MNGKKLRQHVHFVHETVYHLRIILLSLCLSVYVAPIVVVVVVVVVARENLIDSEKMRLLPLICFAHSFKHLFMLSNANFTQKPKRNAYSTDDFFFLLLLLFFLGEAMCKTSGKTFSGVIIYLFAKCEYEFDCSTLYTRFCK